jgi:hypothetical protein
MAFLNYEIPESLNPYRYFSTSQEEYQSLDQRSRLFHDNLRIINLKKMEISCKISHKKHLNQRRPVHGK